MAKATFQINDLILKQAKDMVLKGHAKNLSNFVENALKDMLKKIRMEEIKEELKKASQDPLFLEDIKEINDAFQYVDYAEESK